ncbi:hypothetical protein [Terrisporobacter sp.]|uniref:hypothetical protein n=1 Tax=Terrisporobacter sp. TaxID=1965305 RepID=UPI00289DE860|nr:hypothetical protein [Terrisporobacter sp.]
MNVEQKIKIYKPSIKHLDIINTYEYKEVKEEINKINGTCIIHMIPKMDTYLSDNESDLVGYCDSIMCEIRVFDVDNNIYYKDESLFDNILIEDINVETRIYKDLSTMYIFTKPSNISYGCNTLYVESN